MQSPFRIRQNLSYLRYVLRHKWFVFKYRHLSDCSLWRALIHDLSKFRPREWSAYRDNFYERDGSKKKRYREGREFNEAWLSHIHSNKHHWQHWLLHNDDGTVKALPMPDSYVREMVGDWVGAGLAITGRIEVWQWWDRCKANIMLHDDTLATVERNISKIRSFYGAANVTDDHGLKNEPSQLNPNISQATRDICNYMVTMLTGDGYEGSVLPKVTDEDEATVIQTRDGGEIMRRVFIRNGEIVKTIISDKNEGVKHGD